jgi:hypothetical protein
VWRWAWADGRALRGLAAIAVALSGCGWAGGSGTPGAAAPRSYLL